MITQLEDYWKLVMETGTEEAKSLLQTEALFARTEAAAVLLVLGQAQDEAVAMIELEKRLMCLLIAHRGPVLAQFLMERGRGVPMATDGPGPVVP